MAKIMIGTPNYTGMMDSAVASRIAQVCAKLTKQGHNVAWMVVRRTFICKARHEVAWIAKEWKADWLLWIDDDALVPEDIFEKLSVHDKDIVIAPYPMRTQPYECGVLRAKDGEIKNPYAYYNLDWEKDLNQGLIEVDGGGTHCMLTKVSVYGEPLNQEEAAMSEGDALKHYSERCPGQIPYPWFVLAPLGGTEDMYFCLQGRRVGIKIYCDSDQEAGHISYPLTISKEDAKRCRELKEKGEDLPKLQGALRSIDVLPVGSSEATPTSKNTSAASVGTESLLGLVE